MVIKSRINPSINPRKFWTNKYVFKNFPNFKGRIEENQRVEVGRALCNLSNQAIGLKILQAKKNGEFDSDLIDAAVVSIHQWVTNNNVTHVSCIPGLNERQLVPKMARKIAKKLKLPFVDCLKKNKKNKPQKKMETTLSQKENLDGVFKVIKKRVPKDSKLLLIDDIVDSRWTITIAGALLKNAGANKVFPFCLGKITPYYWIQRELRKKRERRLSFPINN